MQLPPWLQNRLSTPQGMTVECKDEKSFLKKKKRKMLSKKYSITAFCKQKNLLSNTLLVLKSNSIFAML